MSEYQIIVDEYGSNFAAQQAATSASVATQAAQEVKEILSTTVAGGIISDRAKYDSKPAGFVFLCVTDGRFYTRVGDTGWDAGTTGPQGIQGIQGVSGATWYSGNGYPSVGQGADNDFYFKTDTGDVYKKISGSWSVICNIKGPTGSTGATGAQGIQGVQGPGVPTGGLANQVLKKNSATDNDTSWSSIANALGYTPIDSANLGVASGVATLGLDGRLRQEQIPASLVGALVYQGTWNASTNTPSITSSVGTKGYYYKVSVAGTTTIDGQSEWKIGDMIVFNGDKWDGIDGVSTEVVSVAGRVGAIVLTKDDISGLSTDITNINNSLSSLNSSMSTTNTSLENKVDKVTGKGLSTEDYTTAEKAKLASVSLLDCRTFALMSGVSPFKHYCPTAKTALSAVVSPSAATTGTMTIYIYSQVVGSATVNTVATLSVPAVAANIPTTIDFTDAAIAANSQVWAECADLKSGGSVSVSVVMQ